MKSIIFKYTVLLIMLILSAQKVMAQTTYTTNTNPVGLEYNLLFNAKDHYQVTQSGGAAYSNSKLVDLFDGSLLPLYSSIGPTDTDPYEVLIEGLPTITTRGGSRIGWTTRYWGAKRFKIEAYNTRADLIIGWKTIADFSTISYSGNDFMTTINPVGSFSKLRFTFYEGSGSSGRLGISELIFLHPEATSPYKSLIGSNSPWQTTENNGITYAGNVGIGVESPTEKLHVKGNTLLEGNTIINQYSPRIFLRRNTDEGGFIQGIQTQLKDKSPNFYFGNLQSNEWIISKGAYNGSRLFTVKSSGDVGIGTIAPDMKLSVLASDKYISRFHTTDTESLMTGIRIGRKKAVGASYADLVNLNDGFGIAAGYSGGNLPLNTQNTSDIAIFTTYNTKNVGIGTVTPGAWKLAVNGNIRAKEIKVETGWSDFVFEKDYRLPTLKEVEKHIQEKGHLQDIPSAADVAENGIFLGEMDSKLLQKIEELMLYTIQQNKRIDLLEKEIKSLKGN